MDNLILFFLGISIGSFLGLVIDRFPEQSIIFPNSHCGNCHTRLKIWDLIPILSQLITKSLCRYCGNLIPYWYAGFEFTCGLIFLMTYWGVLTWWQAYFIIFSLTLSIYDLKTQSYPLLIWIIGSLPLVVTGQFNRFSLIFLLLALMAELNFIKMGSGDFLYLASMSCLLDPFKLFWSLQIACLLAVAYILVRRLRHQTIPFVPFLSLGFLVALFL